MSALWHRVEADPDLLESLRASLGGRDDALDLLWWAEHPGQPTPSGVPDPGAELERRRRALYRAGSSSDDAADVARATAAHDDDVARALVAARSAAAAQDAERARQRQPQVDERESGRTHARRPSGPLVTILAAGVALVIGCTIGALASGGGDATPTRGAVRALRVFARSQVASIDRPSETERVPIVDPGSIRRLRADTSIGTTLYAARAPGGQVCVFVVVLSQASPPACTSPAAFGSGGLTLLVRATADPTDDSGRRPIDELVLTWNPNDTVSITPLEVGSTSPEPTGTTAGS